MTPGHFDPAAQQRLAAFLAAPERHPASMSYPELAGFLFVVCSCPELIQPSEWLEAVLDENDPGYRDEAEARQILGDLMALYNHINNGCFSGAPELPPGCDWLEPAEANFDDDAPISQWSRGFAQGHDWLAEVWDAAAPEEWENDLGASMMVLSFFAKRELAEAYRQETQAPFDSIEAMAQEQRELFPESLELFAGMGRSLTNTPAPPPEPARSSKVGRNAPCPCGSGKKYKKCCGLRH